MPTATSSRLVATSCAIALAIGFAACGDEDDETSAANTTGGAATTSATSDGSAARPADDEAQIRALVAEIQRGFKTGDGDVVCDGLTEAGQSDLVAFGRSIGQNKPCPGVAAGITRTNRAAKLEQPPTRIVTVRVQGSKATALIKIGRGAPLRQQYRKVDGEWKVLTFGLRNANG